MMLQTELENVVNKMNEKDIKKFLLEVLESNNQVYDEFRRQHLNLFSMISEEEYKAKLDKEIKNCFNYQGYIGEDESFAYCHVLDNYIEEAKKLIELKNYNLAFSVLVLILNTVPVYEPDDSFGVVNDTMVDCINIVVELFDKVYLTDDEETKKKMLDFILHEIESYDLANYWIDIYLLIQKFIENDLFVEEIKNTILNVIQNNEQKREKENAIKLLNRVESIKK